jgi:nucleotide-binding universal stress UspA family protein
MPPFEPHCILAATDFSEVSTWALRHAVMWAQSFHAGLIVLHAQDFPPVGADPYFGSYTLPTLTEATEEALRQHLSEYAAEYVPAGVAVRTELMSGSPPSVIEEYAASNHADMVVLGTHGRGGITRLLLGSVAERTLRIAQRPILIAHKPLPATGQAGDGETGRRGDEENVPDPSTRPIAPSQLRHVLCPVNYTDVARIAFEHACSVSRTFGARLTVVFAVEPQEGYLAPGALRAAEEQLRAWLPMEDATEFQMQPIVRHGDAGEQVITLAREADVDLIVIGAQHRRFVDTTVLGVTTVRVTRHASCPVLVIPRR